jgi:hypothetical protein
MEQTEQGERSRTGVELFLKLAIVGFYVHGMVTLRDARNTIVLLSILITYY